MWIVGKEDVALQSSRLTTLNDIYFIGTDVHFVLTTLLFEKLSCILGCFLFYDRYVMAHYMYSHLGFQNEVFIHFQHRTAQVCNSYFHFFLRISSHAC